MKSNVTGLEFGRTMNDLDNYMPKNRGDCFDFGQWFGCKPNCPVFAEGECKIEDPDAMAKIIFDDENIDDKTYKKIKLMYPIIKPFLETLENQKEKIMCDCKKDKDLNITTSKDFEIFKTECNKWIKYLGLVRWEIDFEHKKLDGNLAEMEANLNSSHCFVRLSTDWEELEVTPEEVKKSARHEILELLLARLRITGQSRYVTGYEITEATHEIIQSIENTFIQNELKDNSNEDLTYKTYYTSYRPKHIVKIYNDKVLKESLEVMNKANDELKDLYTQKDISKLCQFCLELKNRFNCKPDNICFDPNIMMLTPDAPLELFQRLKGRKITYKVYNDCTNLEHDSLVILSVERVDRMLINNEKINKIRVDIALYLKEERIGRAWIYLKKLQEIVLNNLKDENLNENTPKGFPGFCSLCKDQGNNLKCNLGENCFEPKENLNENT